MKWEVVFDIEPFLNGREREEKVHEELWNETFHHLAGRSIINDFEHMADKECEIEHGELYGDSSVWKETGVHFKIKRLCSSKPPANSDLIFGCLSSGFGLLDIKLFTNSLTFWLSHFLTKSL